ncbi:glycosyltransferase family 4 protein [Paracrocinitomix mangrovi]|uniref:glycosyltransferase family 4 protein n=1 Tax=Paracrocinitomix mangrovi TaxID=2862509 RepID=UPI001C8D66BF|nr:glycosyltransferase family 4 protein [Paracrocinitomix mangrovi]UKN02859.1 glycosyltransferase family 4 protein [Paracrocinitomix mangrovi]
MPIKVLAISDYSEFHSVRPEAEIFIGLKKLGLDVHIMTYGDCEYAQIFRDNGIKVIDFHPQKKFDKEEQKFIRETIVKEDYDIIHLFNSRAIIHGIKAAKGLKTKVVLYRGYSGNIHWYDPTAYLKFLHPRVDAIMCNSVGVEEIIKKQKLYNKQKAVTINKGHRTSWYDKVSPSNIREEFGIPEDAFLLINVANNRRMKGIPYLLQAMNMLPEGLNIHLVLLGKGMDDEENMALINAGPYKDKIHLPGFRPNALENVAAADVFVLPSIMGESITKSVIEAMSLKKAPIITDIAGNVELVEDGVSGVVVPKKDPQALADAILKLYNDRSFTSTLAENAKKRIDNELSADRTIEKVKALYEELLQNVNV